MDMLNEQKERKKPREKENVATYQGPFFEFQAALIYTCEWNGPIAFGSVVKSHAALMP